MRIIVDTTVGVRFNMRAGVRVCRTTYKRT